MNYSYWENKEWFNGNDFTIVGSGIVGLTCAISLREKYPNSKIIKKKDALPYSVNKILEKKAPQKPKKFVISDFAVNLPIPGSFKS